MKEHYKSKTHKGWIDIIMLMKETLKKLNTYIKVLIGFVQWTLLKHKIARNELTWYFVCNGHIGDTIVFLRFLQIFAQRQNYPPITLIGQTKQKELLTFFALNCNVILKPKLPYYEINNFVAQNTPFKKSELLPGYFNPLFLVDSNIYHHTDIFKLVLRLPFLEKYKGAPSLQMKRSVEHKYSLNESDKKLIVLSPHAKSIRGLSLGTWEYIANSLKNKGYNVVTNISEKEQAIKGTNRISIPLNEMGLNFFNEVDGVISVRNGLSDFLFLTDCRLIVIYPDQHSLTFNCLQYYNTRPNLYELIQNTDIAEKILSLF